MWPMRGSARMWRPRWGYTRSQVHVYRCGEALLADCWRAPPRAAGRGCALNASSMYAQRMHVPCFTESLSQSSSIIKGSWIARYTCDRSRFLFNVIVLQGMLIFCSAHGSIAHMDKALAMIAKKIVLYIFTCDDMKNGYHFSNGN